MSFTSPVVIGLEIHVQLNTRTKLFCGCRTSADAPNSATCPICLGHPGAKPVLNRIALEKAAVLALALGCTINATVQFSRKTYFYPDMSKNYQITQFELPLGADGALVLDSGKRVGIKRAHIEEDPAALVHQSEASYTLVDYNRSGVPLVEIVTEPAMDDPEEAREFIKKLMHVISYCKVFDENEGIIKADANVSIKETGYTRVEIKNITGAKEIERALEAEVARQHRCVKDGETVVQETRGWDAAAGITKAQRLKESEDDYGYIIDPDLPTIIMSDAMVATLRQLVPELGADKAKRFVDQYGIDDVDAQVMAKEIELGQLFERVAQRVEPVLAARWMRRELRRALAAANVSAADVDDANLVELLLLLQHKTITDRIGQRLTDRLVVEGISPAAVVKSEGLGAVSDEGAIKAVVVAVIKDNGAVVEDFKKGSDKAFNFLVGQCMKQLKGKGSPQVITKILKEALA
ncbi:MAG: Asp-tRNA(Asn)/Glu-tRNA(Gln) amidotransferase subunit GatB [Nanoarchaeota archaeon]